MEDKDKPITPDQIEDVFIQLIGLPPRRSDQMVLAMVHGGSVTRGSVAEYIWDHWMGEPDEPSEAEVLAAVSKALDENPADRAARALARAINKEEGE